MDQLKDTLYVLYGSRTGNAKAVAVLAYDYALSLGYKAVLQDMQDMNYQELENIEHLLVIVSTHGEGEPPVQAEGFYDFIHTDEVKSVGANFAVLGLGDSSYRYFCQTGKDIDKRLKDLGGNAIMEPESCDIDFEETAKAWVKNVFNSLEGKIPVVNKPKKDGFTFELNLGDGSLSAFKAELLEKKLLTTADSSKKVLHVSLSLKNSGIDYYPGDAIGVYATNSRSFVDELLRKLEFDKAYPVEYKDGVRMLKDLLVHEYELSLLTPVVINKYAEIVSDESLQELVADGDKLNKYAVENDVLDLVADFPGTFTVEQFVGTLRKLSQRLYSVASSRNEVGEQADITVKIIENSDVKRTRNGVCSSFLWNRLDVGDMVPVALESIPKFRLPEDLTKPVIMIGAGTGIAPFRGFLQDREALGAKGKNWLIFGERNSTSDFLYQDELIDFQQKGLITEFSTAFSRDQEKKVYVSHVIEQKADMLMEWLNDGAIVYVCGSKDNLAKSVRESFVRILADSKKLSETDAQAEFESLKSNKQYLEEVY